MAFLLNHLLTESADKFPDREAIIYRDQVVTYAELERKTNRLSHKLLMRGIERGSLVGIYTNRGIDSIVSAFAVLKTGAAYVPLDPLIPSERMTYIMSKCKMKSLLTLREKLPRLLDVLNTGSPLRNIFVLDGMDPAFAPSASMHFIDCQALHQELGDSPPPTGTIDTDLAYILFTSGSTGYPKGVMLSHLNALTFVRSAHEFFKIVPADRLSNICPLHFDMSVFDIFVAFRAGASVVIIPETMSIFPVKLAQAIEKHKITVWNSVPSALSLLATYRKLDNHDLSSLRLILFAGEIFPMKYLRRLLTILPSARFSNMYGQTEANSSTCYWVDRESLDGKTSLPIGKPFPNFEVFALDQDGRVITKTGQEGELYIRASTVALGYMDDPERTEKSFVKNPLGSYERGERVYRTGDMVCRDSDGNFLFLGRKDHMIKSRGYRIEIGEIETAVCDHPDVNSAVVIPIPDELIGNRISLIVVPSKPGSVRKEEVVQFCARRLPKYMVPEIIEFRDALPRTSSGKIDRKKLGDPHKHPG